MLDDTAECRKCGTKFNIPEDSVESAGDNDSWAKWVTKDISCPKCEHIVYKELEEIAGWLSGGY